MPVRVVLRCYVKRTYTQEPRVWDETYAVLAAGRETFPWGSSFGCVELEDF